MHFVTILCYLIARRIKEIVAQNKGNTVLELQQRSIEFNSIIQRHQSIKWVTDSAIAVGAFSNIFVSVR